MGNVTDSLVERAVRDAIRADTRITRDRYREEPVAWFPWLIRHLEPCPVIRLTWAAPEAKSSMPYMGVCTQHQASMDEMWPVPEKVKKSPMYVFEMLTALYHIADGWEVWVATGQCPGCKAIFYATKEQEAPPRPEWLDPDGYKR